MATQQSLQATALAPSSYMLLSQVASKFTSLPVVLWVTPPHTPVNVPQDSQRATFNYAPQENMNGVGTLTFDKQDFTACLTGKEGEYQVYAWIPKVNGNLRTNCTSIRIRTVRYTEAAAWSYAR